MKKIIYIALISMLVICVPSVSAAYNYSPLLDVVASSEALIINQVIDSSNLVDSDNKKIDYSFGTLIDVACYDNKIYLVDSSNNKIIVLDEKYHFLDSFPKEEVSLNSPKGIYITENKIYVADTNNLRIAIFDHDYKFLSQITSPDDPTFKKFPTDKEGYDFKPIKLAVDKNERVYVVAEQIFEGIIDFNPDGTFSRYIGGNTVTLSAWDAFWLMFTSEEQRKAQGYRLASTFVNLDVDGEGYLYTVSSSSEGSKAIKKLNYKGKDVLIRNGYFQQTGDVKTIGGRVKVPTGASEFIDIEITDYGTYTVLDKTRGRIFTYDEVGALLYIGGQLGNIGGVINNQSSLFLKPEAISYFQDHLLVVDSLNKNLVVMEYTPFAKLVNQATKYYHSGEYFAARQVWEEVLALNTNYYLAYAGIGKAQLRDGNYKEAMVNLKIGYDDLNYSKAYKQYRYDQLTLVFPYIIGIGMMLIVYLFIKSIRSSVKKEGREEKNE